MTTNPNPNPNPNLSPNPNPEPHLRHGGDSGVKRTATPTLTLSLIQSLTRLSAFIYRMEVIQVCDERTNTRVLCCRKPRVVVCGGFK